MGWSCLGLLAHEVLPLIPWKESGENGLPGGPFSPGLPIPQCLVQLDFIAETCPVLATHESINWDLRNLSIHGD